MGIITLLTDFGTEDEYVGLMKGVILSINPAALIVDITHHIEPQDIIEAAYTINSSYGYFPQGTVHLTVVDPGVGGKRAIIALQTMGHLFLAPDNGVLTLLFDKPGEGRIIRVNNADYFLKSISPTFHGRDKIAPTGAYLTKGVKPSELGPEINWTDVVRLADMGCRISDTGELMGKIVSIDHFGNLITNIDSKDLVDYCQKRRDGNPRIRVGKRSIRGLVKTYESAKRQTALALIGSRGYLEVAVNGGSAKQYFNVNQGDVVRVVI